MVNRYPAPCRYCGGTIPPDGGTVERVGQSWLAAHSACAIAPRRELVELQAAAFKSTPQRSSR